MIDLPMALKMRKTSQYLAVAIMVASIFAGVAYFVVKPQPNAVAAPLSQSVLCMPNNCNAIESNDSVQDITIHNELGNSGERWRIRENNDTNGDADRQVLEIANQDNHYMREVSVGVYVTSDIYNAMPGNSLWLSFVNRGCNTGDDPNWSISVTNPLTSATNQLATYNTASGSPTRTAANAFCSNSGTVRFNLSNYKSSFVPYSGGNSLMYAKINVRFNTYTASPTRDERNVRFQLRLNNLCGATTTCRQYIALVEVDNGENRNVALSVRGATQKRVTTSSTEYNNNRSTYDLFGRRYDQDAMRVYMEFGLPCTQATAQRLPIYIYDINDGDSNSPETHGWVGGKDISGVVLQYYNELNNAWETLPSSSYDSSNPQRVIVTSGGLALSHNTNTISSRNHYLYAVNGSPAPTNVIIPSNSDRATTTVSLYMQPYTKYRLAITPDASHNFIAAGLPGDQIYGLAGCDTYGLTPTVTGSNSIAPGMVAEFGNSIRSDPGSSSVASGVEWYSYGFVVPSGQAIPGVPVVDYSNTSQACIGLTACIRMGSGTAPDISPGGLVSLGNTQYTNTAGLSVGDRVCSYLAINPWVIPSAGDAWRASSVVCHTIVAQPKVHIWGNDLRVGSSFYGGATNLPSIAKGSMSASNGSWVEYAITAPNAVDLLASQSGAINGTTETQLAWSKLTFANEGDASCQFGCFSDAGMLGSIPDVKNALADSSITYNRGAANVSVSNIPSFVGGANLASFNTSAVVVTTGNIAIDQNIVYNPGSLVGSQNIPQLVLIGDNITIAEGVTRVDAWLIATNTLSTCNRNQSDLRSTNCNLPLRVNGPVMAGQLLMNRTTNSPTDPTVAAEVINLRGDAYIWANRISRLNGSWQTVYTIELPPRY